MLLAKAIDFNRDILAPASLFVELDETLLNVEAGLSPFSREVAGVEEAMLEEEEESCFEDLDFVEFDSVNFAIDGVVGELRGDELDVVTIAFSRTGVSGAGIMVEEEVVDVDAGRGFEEGKEVVEAEVGVGSNETS